jgi:hypothetical protein
MVFARLNSFFSYLLCSIVVLIGLVPISFMMFASGVWVDFALPLVAVQLREFASEFESIQWTFWKRKRSQASKADANATRSPADTVKTTTKDEDPTV